jgi:spermidine synthase
MKLMQTNMTRGSSILVVSALFFGSGALALIYQVVWARMMTHAFGSTALAVGTVLAAFMSGLAFGSWYFGRFADRSSNPLRSYAQLEIGVALSALASHLLLDRLDTVYPILHGLVGGSDLLVALIRFAAAFLLVMAPTVLMGATLPVLIRSLVNRQGSVGSCVSTLYSINTLGAVTGVLLTGFFLIGRYGIHVPVMGAVIGNLLIGSFAWIASRRVNLSLPVVQPTEALPDCSHEVEEEPDRWTINLILVGIAISGFTSFAYEIYWTRSLVFILGSSTYALTTMLSAFLTGIALGGYLVRFVINRFKDRAAIFGWIQVILGVVSALALPFLFFIGDPQAMNDVLVGISERAFPMILTSFIISFLVMLVPAVLIGATFPLVSHLAVRRLDKTGTSIGRVYAINTIGNVIGALLPGLVLLGWLGIQKGILVMAVLNLLLGLVVLSSRLLRPSRHPAWRVVLPAVLISSVLLMMRAPLQFQFPSQGEPPDASVLYYREGPLATTKVFTDPQRDEKIISVDGIGIGGTGYTEFKQLLLAHLPRLLMDETARELSIGLGSGMLAGESARHADTREITVVEIEPSVIEGAAFFEEENHGILNDPRLEIVSDDIKNFLRTTDRKYQVISADEKTLDEYASNGFSYSLEYYDLVRDHLEPEGLVVQWVPSTLPPTKYQMVLKTFAHCFPHVQLWQFLPAYELGPFNSLLVGSLRPVNVDAGAMKRRFARRRDALQSLAPYGVTSAAALLPHFIADERDIREAVATAPLNTHDHPRYEFYPPWGHFSAQKENAILNQEFILALKRKAHPDFCASISSDGSDLSRLEESFTAEFLYLEGFQQYLGGMSPGETLRQFDNILKVAPWNDSLRARIYCLYHHAASSQLDPATRTYIMDRAEGLYD